MNRLRLDYTVLLACQVFNIPVTSDILSCPLWSNIIWNSLCALHRYRDTYQNIVVEADYE